MTIKLSDFDLYRDLLYTKSGLVLSQDKTYLLESRLTPVAKKWGHETLESMAVALRSFPDAGLVKDIIEAMTTNETSFFRDQKPFTLFENIVVPAFLANKARAGKKLRMWCAAASTGQEPYSLAMTIREKDAVWKGLKFDITGTDICDEALGIARAGKYSQFEVQRGLPIALLMKYFKKIDDTWHLSDEIKSMIKYENFNLLDDMKKFGTLDIIFCRNVLIYFDEKTKAQVLARMYAQLAPDGFLFLGGAETTIGITDKFKPLDGARGLYVRPDFPGLPAGVGPGPIPGVAAAKVG